MSRPKHGLQQARRTDKTAYRKVRIIEEAHLIAEQVVNQRTQKEERKDGELQWKSKQSYQEIKMRTKQNKTNIAIILTQYNQK